MELDLQVSPEEITSREVELGCKSWTSFASSCSTTAVQRTLSLWLCPSTAVETAIAQCTSRCPMARGHRLNTSIVLAAVHGLSGLFRAVSAVEPSLFRPLPPLSPSLISHLASVDVKQYGPNLSCLLQTYCRLNIIEKVQTKRINHVILIAKMCISMLKNTLTPSFHCPWYLKISSGSEMFNCEKLKNENCAHCNQGEEA